MADKKFLEYRGNSWRFVQRKGGERIQKTLGTDSLTKARNLRDLYLATGTWHSVTMVERGRAYRKQIESETDKEYSASILFEDIVTDIEDEHGADAAHLFIRVAEGELPLMERLDAWHEDKRTGIKLKERTKADHRTAITRLVAWLKTKGIEAFTMDVTQRIAEDYLDHLVAIEVHPRTGNKALSSIRSMWNFMRVSPNPWSGLTMDETNTTDKKERAFTREEVAALLAGTSDETMQAAMRIACLTGARLEEIFQIKISDIKDNVFWIINSKRKGPITKRPVPIHSELAQLVKDLSKKRDPDQYLIIKGDATGWDGTRSMAFSKRFATYRRKMGVNEVIKGQRRSKVNFHSFRRWLATELERLEVPEIVAARVVGHKLSTMTYGLYSDGADLKVLRDGLEKVKLPSK
jgi:integrase